ncbi:putative protein EXORDIUM [Helianthus annuus]|nr:putative protein EXORDIUM [Helianthus annuus]
MGREFGRGLGENTQVTTPGGLGLWRDPLGLGFQAGHGASPSPSVAQWWKALETYTDLTGSKVTQSVTLGHEKNDRLSHGRKLTRLAVQSVTSTAIRAKTNPLPADPTGGLYLVLTSSDIIVEGFCRSICGFHYITFPSIVGYTLPFA